MKETRINELILKGTVTDEAGKNQTDKNTSTPIDREELIEACLDRVKAYLKYEQER